VRLRFSSKNSLKTVIEPFLLLLSKLFLKLSHFFKRNLILVVKESFSKFHEFLVNCWKGLSVIGVENRFFKNKNNKSIINEKFWCNAIFLLRDSLAAERHKTSFGLVFQFREWEKRNRFFEWIQFGSILASNRTSNKSLKVCSNAFPNKSAITVLELETL
jgi:hypothetical protein